jgi:hypothetical protein
MKKCFLYSLLLALIVALYFSIKNDKVKKVEKVDEISTSIISKPQPSEENNNINNSTYVKPYTTTNGKFIKGHRRKSVSTDPSALKKRAKSRYYYKTHKHIIKERRKRKSK